MRVIWDKWLQKCLETNGLGYEVFNVSNDDHSVHCTSEDLIETYYQGVPIKGDEIPQSFYTNAKAKTATGISTRAFMA